MVTWSGMWNQWLLEMEGWAVLTVGGEIDSHINRKKIEHLPLASKLCSKRFSCDHHFGWGCHYLVLLNSSFHVLLDLIYDLKLYNRCRRKYYYCQRNSLTIFSRTERKSWFPLCTTIIVYTSWLRLLWNEISFYILEDGKTKFDLFSDSLLKVEEYPVFKSKCI